MVLPSDPAHQPVIITYATPPTFLASPNWNKVYSTILSLLPLRNLHWKPASRSSIKTIQELNASLVQFESFPDEVASQVPGTLLEKPMLHLFILHCEDNDLETYQTESKRYLKDWHTIVSSRKNQEWLILQIIRPDQARGQPGGLFQIKNSVLDKLKKLNTEKRDRCIQLNWHSGTDNPAVWAELVNKLKEGLIYAFDSAIIQREEEVKRSESQQAMPGWNYCTFFILKESLASSFEGMNLLEDALIQYDELEALFHHVSRERNMSWFGSLIHPDLGDDSSPLLSISHKPYRDLILANSISIFDFRNYLLARQCRLLAKMGNFSELTTRVGFFLGTLAKQLREAQSNLPPFFIETWTYSSSLSAVEQCNTWATEFKMEISKFNAGRGELLDIARTQLDVFGIAAGHLPASAPFSLSLSPTMPLPSPLTLQLSNETLNVALHNRQAFEELYIALTNRAVDFYAKSGRRKFALKLHGFLAAFELHRGKFDRALNTFISLPAHYSPHAWTSLEALMLHRALQTHSQLGKPQASEWLHMVLSFLKAYVEDHNDEILIQEVDKVEYVSNLVDSLRKSAETLENDVIQPDNPIVSVWVSNEVRLAKTRDGSYLDATVTNHLPCTLPAERIIVTIAGRDSEKLRYECAIDKGCSPGRTAYTLFCPTSSVGSFVLETSEIVTSRLTFQSNHRKLSTKQAGRLPFLIRVPRDLLAVDVRISQSPKIVLGESQSLIVVVFTGRNHLRKLRVKFSSPSVTFRCREAVLQEDDEGEEIAFEAAEDCVYLEDVEEDTEISFLVPHSDASGLSAMRVSLEVEYATESEPSLLRTAQFSKVMITTLPIAVNVEDFFRGTRLISKFMISTTNHQHVRIAEARLEPPPGGLDGVKIQHPARRSQVISVTPSQPANFLFILDSSNGPVRESLHLSIKYRTLREEVEGIIEREIETVLEESPSTLENRIILVGKLIDALDGDAGWVELYGITGELVVPDTPEDDVDSQDVLLKVKKRLADHRHPHPAAGSWREIQIPMDVPLMNIVAAVTLQILSTPFATTSSNSPSLYAGQPISAQLTIHTSFHWGQVSNEAARYLLRYNIEEMIREWLISGPKRGDFVAVDGGIHTVPITLIALHHGEFFLPKVSVTALPIAGTEAMGSLAVPSIDTHQVHGAEQVRILPRGGRSTFVVGMGPTVD